MTQGKFLSKTSQGNVLVLIAETAVVAIGAWFYSAGCGVEYTSQFNVYMQNENYEGAKALLIQQLAEDNFLPPEDEGRSVTCYRLAYVYGLLGEYDSMKTSVDRALRYNGNLAKSRRIMLEYFSIDAFNGAVSSYNNFFFDKAIDKFHLSIAIVGMEPPYEEYSAVILRCLAYAEASRGNIERSLNYCRQAATLGDGLSQRILELWDKEKKINPPEKIEPKEKPLLKVS